MTKSLIGRFILYLKKRHNLTVNQMLERLNIKHEQNYYRWLYGKALPNLERKNILDVISKNFKLNYQDKIYLKSLYLYIIIPDKIKELSRKDFKFMEKYFAYFIGKKITKLERSVIKALLEEGV